jgi:hypothetical protein
MMKWEQVSKEDLGFLQKRYAEGIKEMVLQWIQHKPFNEDNYIVREGKLADQYS